MALGVSRTQSTELIGQAIKQGLIQPGEYNRPKKRASLATAVGLDDDRVVEVLTAVKRCGGRGYCKDGKRYALRKALMEAVGITIITAEKIIKKAVLAGLLPVVERPSKPPTRPRTAPEKKERKKPGPAPKVALDNESGEGDD